MPLVVPKTFYLNVIYLAQRFQCLVCPESFEIKYELGNEFMFLWFELFSIAVQFYQLGLFDGIS